jgi:hypothetical protein
MSEFGKSTAKTPRTPRRRSEETILVSFRSSDFLGVLGGLAVDRSWRIGG